MASMTWCDDRFSGVDKHFRVSPVSTRMGTDRRTIAEGLIQAMCKLMRTGVNVTDTGTNIAGHININMSTLAVLCCPDVYLAVSAMAQSCWGNLPDPIEGVTRGDMLVTIISATGYSIRDGIINWPKSKDRSFATLWVMANRLAEILSTEIFEFIMAGRNCIGFCEATNITADERTDIYVCIDKVPTYMQNFNVYRAVDVTDKERTVIGSRIEFERTCKAKGTGSRTGTGTAFDSPFKLNMVETKGIELI